MRLMERLGRTPSERVVLEIQSRYTASPLVYYLQLSNIPAGLGRGT